jgi:predicted ATPase
MSSSKPIKIVLTGGPGSGKTTLLNKLRSLGYATVDEPAEIVLSFMASFLSSEQAQADWRRTTPNPIDWLQDKILKVAAIQEEVVQRLNSYRLKKKKGSMVFFDRGLHDSLIYFKIHKRKVPRVLMQACKRARYDLVLVLETPPASTFTNKAGRNTTERGDSVKMGEMLLEVYDKYFPGKTLLVPWSRHRVPQVLEILRSRSII